MTDTITIKELIKKLKKYDENLPVFVCDSEWGLEPCKGIIKTIEPKDNHYNGTKDIEIL